MDDKMLALISERVDLLKVAYHEQRARADALADERHKLANQVMQEQGKTMEAWADVQALLTLIRHYTTAPDLDERLRAWGALCDIALVAHPGAALLAELEAARKVVKAARSMPNTLIMEALDAYDALTKEEH